MEPEEQKEVVTTTVEMPPDELKGQLNRLKKQIYILFGLIVFAFAMGAYDYATDTDEVRAEGRARCAQITLDVNRALVGIFEYIDTRRIQSGLGPSEEIAAMTAQVNRELRVEDC